GKQGGEFPHGPLETLTGTKYELRVMNCGAALPRIISHENAQKHKMRAEVEAGVLGRVERQAHLTPRREGAKVREEFFGRKKAQEAQKWRVPSVVRPITPEYYWF